MPVLVVQHTHVLVVVLFLLLLIVKAFLLFTNNAHALQKIRKSTNMFDLVLGGLLVVSGVYLVLKAPELPVWLLVKTLLALLAIPISLAGFRKLNKPLVGLSLLMFIYVYGISENKNLNLKKAENLPQAAPKSPGNARVPAEKTPAEVAKNPEMPGILATLNQDALKNAKIIYVQQCQGCHGKDGKKRFQQTPDLATSTLTRAEKQAVILNGRGDMPAYRGQLSEPEAEALAAYTEKLRK